MAKPSELGHDDHRRAALARTGQTRTPGTTPGHERTVMSMPLPCRRASDLLSQAATQLGGRSPNRTSRSPPIPGVCGAGVFDMAGGLSCQRTQSLARRNRVKDAVRGVVSRLTDAFARSCSTGYGPRWTPSGCAPADTCRGRRQTTGRSRPPGSWIRADERGRPRRTAPAGATSGRSSRVSPGLGSSRSP